MHSLKIATVLDIMKWSLLLCAYRFVYIIQWGKLSEEQTSLLLKQVLSCLNYCHGQKVIHRDIKPDNILLEKNKDFSRVKVIDFGYVVFPLVFASNHLELVCLKFDSIPSFATRFEEGVEMTERVGTPEYSKCGAVFLMFPSSVLLILAFLPSLFCISGS